MSRYRLDVILPTQKVERYVITEEIYKILLKLIKDNSLSNMITDMINDSSV
jgi:hypothetical protein